MRLAVSVGTQALFVMALAGLVYGQPGLVPPECLWGREWAGYDSRICGEKDKSEFQKTIERPGKFCLISRKAGSVVCVFDELNDCMRIAANGGPGDAVCKPNTGNLPAFPTIKGR